MNSKIKGWTKSCQKGPKPRLSSTLLLISEQFTDTGLEPLTPFCLELKSNLTESATQFACDFQLSTHSTFSGLCDGLAPGPQLPSLQVSAKQREHLYGMKFATSSTLSKFLVAIFPHLKTTMSPSKSSS